MMTTTTPLPAAATALLQEDYEGARTALAQCESVDECRACADRAASLASHAKHAKDRTLETMAQRIRARAVRRAGELLQQVGPVQGARDDKREAGAHPTSRNEVAKAAGFSDHQVKQALRVAAVPEADFERQVKSSTPPTVTELARLGTRASPGRPPASSAPRPLVDLKEGDPEETDRAIPFVGAVEDALRAIEKVDVEVVPLLPPDVRAMTLNLVGQIDVITDSIIVKMSQGRSMPRRAP